jgi:hypothetical protein
MEFEMENLKVSDDLTKKLPKKFVPHISDIFVYSAVGGTSIAVVKEMVRNPDLDGSGYVIYEQYIKNKGEWTRYPDVEIKKSFIGFISRYVPFEETIDHMIDLRKKEAEEQAYISDVLNRNGFPDFQENIEEYRENPQFLDLYGKAYIEATIISLKKEGL